MIGQCMGGWCRSRADCADYHADPVPGREPVERLCPKGQDQPDRVARAEHVRRLAADPRFAAWAAGAPE